MWVVGVALAAAGGALAHVGAGIDVDRQGRVYFVDTIRNRVWRIDPGGKLAVMAKDKHSDFLLVDENGSVYVVHDYFEGEFRWVLSQIAPRGGITELLRSTQIEPGAALISVDPGGNTYFLRGAQITRRSPDGKLSTLHAREWGRTGGKAGKAWSPEGSLVVADGLRVRKVSPNGHTSILAEGLERALSPACDSLGNVYVTEYGNRQVRRIAPDGKVHTVLRSGWPWYPTGVAARENEVYVLERFGDYYQSPPLPGFLAAVTGSFRVRKISADGKVQTLATAR